MDAQQKPSAPTVQPTAMDDVLARTNDVEENRDLAVVSYAWLLSVIVLLARPHSAYVRFHARQGILLFALSIVLWVVPVVGRLLELLVLVGIVLGFIHAAQGQWKDVPVIGPLSRGEFSGIRQDALRVIQSLKGIAQMLKARLKAPPPPSPEQRARSQPEPQPRHSATPDHA